MSVKEIKFRCYDKEEGYMLPWEHLVQAGDLPEMLLHGHEEDESYSKLMQFTGLKDKNGLEIYEGDILEYPDLDKGVYLFKEQPKRRSVMKWHEQDAAFKIPGTGFRINTERVEVIGNIHENPKLLEVNN